MFGGLHSDVTSFWSFGKLITNYIALRIRFDICTDLESSLCDSEKKLTEAKNDLLRCLYRARWYKTSSDIFI